MSASPKAFQFSDTTLPCSIRFAPGVYPAELILREVGEIKAAPAERYRQARRAVLGTLFREMRLVCASAVIQCSPGHPLHSAYEIRATENRALVARRRGRV